MLGPPSPQSTIDHHRISTVKGSEISKSRVHVDTRVNVAAIAGDQLLNVAESGSWPA